MGLRDRILGDLKTFLKSGDRERLGVVRMVKAAIEAREVELRTDPAFEGAIGDDEVEALVRRAAKQRREAADSFAKGGREDLVAKELRELEILEEYLPRGLSEDELRSIVASAVEETGARAPEDLGRVMKVVLGAVAGRADGKVVHRLVLDALSSGDDPPGR